MHDKNGNPVGISSHKFKTNISHSNDGEMVLSLNKDIGEMKFNDQLSNEDILNYSNPKVITNKETFLGAAVEVANNMHKVTNPEQSGNDKEKFDISALPNINNGPTLM